ncbi:MAG TPA: hypothetical protein VGR24_05230 [bacterium]|jgi:hypothetical protein|nr:hypothetical protein [bacterium]
MRTQARLASVIFLLVALVGPSAAASILAPADQPRLTLREREMLRWGTGPGTEVLDNVQVSPVAGGGTLPTFKLDNQSGPMGGGVVFSCPSPAGTFGVNFAYRNVGSSDSPRMSDFQLTCLTRWNPLEMRANGLARRIEFQDNTELLRAVTVPLDPTFRIRLDNRPQRGGLEVVCESPFEGKIDYRYKYRDLDPVVVDGTIAVVCVQF